MDKKSVKYTKHALIRARERRLWKYVSKERFFFDARYMGGNRAIIDNCVYVYKNIGETTKIITMYPLD